MNFTHPPTNGQPRNMRVGTNPSTNSVYGTPRTVNQTAGMLANGSVHSLFQIQAFQNHYEVELREGQLVFAHKDCIVGSGNTCTMMNLPMMNYKLYQCCRTYDKAKHVGRQNMGDEARKAEQSLLGFKDKDWGNKDELQRLMKERMTTTEILASLSPMGVVVTNAAHRVSRIPDHRPHELVLNVCTRGQHKTFNVWGDVLDGDLLYLRLERLRAGAARKRTDPRSPANLLSLNGSDFSMKCDGQNEAFDDTVVGPWQFVPVVHKGRAEAIQDETTWDVYIGRVYLSRRCVQSGKGDINRVRNLCTMVRGDQVDIFVDAC